ncbi:MAG: ankyrin repeat domain-containing protein [Puniceicoccales bacterium]|jgi:ankyrin repeat protein|nr:ankyrin repeat domain-containing protein [Puniceicoccales bacterium]
MGNKKILRNALLGGIFLWGLGSFLLAQPESNGEANDQMNLSEQRERNIKLWKALKKGDEEAVQHLIGEGADINFRGVFGFTRLHRAIEYFKGMEEIQLLLKYGANVNAQSLKGYTPLHLAVQHASQKLLKLLLDAGANPNMQDECGQTPLHWAAYFKNIKGIKTLIAAGAFAVEDNCWQGPWRYIIEERDEMLESETIDEADRQEIEENASEIIKLLLSATNNNTKSDENETPVVLLWDLDEAAIIEYFSKEGDINEKDAYQGDTYLHRFVRESRSKSYQRKIRIALKCGADVNAKDNQGLTPLFFAIVFGHLKVAQLLVDNGTNVNDYQLFRAINFLVSLYVPDSEKIQLVLDLLLNNGANLDEPDPKGNGPLHWAVEDLCLVTVQLFVGRGANVNATNHRGQTPLDLAIENRDVFSERMKEGKDWEKKKNEEKKIAYEEIIEFLQSHGATEGNGA